MCSRSRSRSREAWSATTVLSGWATGALRQDCRSTASPAPRSESSASERSGRRCLTRHAGLECMVLVHDPQHPERARSAGAEPVPLIELARRSDFVSLHVPLRDSTRSLVGAEFLAAMKPTAYLLNAARGGIVDHDRARRCASAWDDCGSRSRCFRARADSAGPSAARPRAPDRNAARCFLLRGVDRRPGTARGGERGGRARRASARRRCCAGPLTVLAVCVTVAERER